MSEIQNHLKIKRDLQPVWVTDIAAEEAADEDEKEFRAEEAAELVPDFKMPFLENEDLY